MFWKACLVLKIRWWVRLIGWLIAGWVVWGAGSLRADLADDFLRVAVEAAGGERALELLRSFRVTGTTQVGGREVSFLLFAARPNLLRVETLGESGSLVRGYDGVHAPWRIASVAGRDSVPERPSEAEERSLIRDAEFDQPVYRPRERGWSVDFAGYETDAEGRSLVRLLAVSRSAEMEIWVLDAASWLMVRRDLREGRVRLYYSDYRDVAGVRLPGRVRLESGGRVVSETVIQDYVANPPLPPDFFAPPRANWPRLR